MVHDGVGAYQLLIKLRAFVHLWEIWKYKYNTNSTGILLILLIAKIEISLTLWRFELNSWIRESAQVSAVSSIIFPLIQILCHRQKQNVCFIMYSIIIDIIYSIIIYYIDIIILSTFVFIESRAWFSSVHFERNAGRNIFQLSDSRCEIVINY